MEAPDDDITIITSFLDIGRGEWNNEWRRQPQYYVDSFLIYLRYPYKMVCYIDDQFIDQVLNEYEKSEYKNKRFIPINKDWLTENIHAWQNFEKERGILSSEQFMKIIQQRFHFMDMKNFDRTRNIEGYLFPENVYPEYTTVTHSKIDLMMHAINNNYVNTPYVSWCDFGIFYSQHKDGKYPNSVLDINKMHREKITMCVSNNVSPKDSNMFFVLVFAPETFWGGFISGKKDLFSSLQTLYHECLDEMHNNNITDDEQHVYLRCYLKNPELFHLVQTRNDPIMNIFSR
uniref:Uncharacterized protein n=1 Tax=viral metagenome TaxID=1070528 RepID=A0A6C0DQE6_9ZZZZ